MRKNLLTLLLLPAILLMACTDDPKESGIGALVISPTIGDVPEHILTRAGNDFTNYFYTLEGPTNKGPETLSNDGTVYNLEPGSYTITVMSHKDGMPNAGFDSPYHFGTMQSAMETGKVTVAKVNMEQLNSGIYFTYSRSLKEFGFEDIVPTVGGQNGTLVYESGNRDKTGYFKPGEAAISLKNGNSAVTIGGQELHKFNAEANKIYTVVLGCDGNGDITIGIEDGPATDNAIRMYKFYGGYYGDYIPNTEAFVEFNFYNGMIDFDKGGTPPFNIFVMEAFCTLPPQDDFYEEFELFTIDLGTYERDFEYSGAPMKFIEGQLEQGTYYAGTHYMEVDSENIYTVYFFETGTVSLSAENGIYTMTADLDGYVVDWSKEDQRGEPVTNFQVTYTGPVRELFVDKRIRPLTPLDPNQFGFINRATHYLDNEQGDFSINFYKIGDTEEDKNLSVSIWGFIPTPDNPFDIFLRDGVYPFSDTGDPYTLKKGWFEGHVLSLKGSNYGETVPGSAPDPYYALTGGEMVVTTIGYKRYHVRLQNLEAMDYDGNPAQLPHDEYFYEGQIYLSYYTREPQEIEVTFNRAEFRYDGETVGYNSGWGILDLRSNLYADPSDDFGKPEHHARIAISTRDLMPRPEQIVIPTGIYAPNSAREPGTFVKGTGEGSELRLSYYTRQLPGGLEKVALVPMEDGTIDVSRDGDIYTISMDVSGKNNRNGVKSVIRYTYVGPINIIDNRP